VACLHANQRATGRDSKLRYIQVAEANLNLQEFLSVYKFFLESKAIPYWLIIGITYDDLREQGIRPYVKTLISDPQKGIQKLNYLTQLSEGTGQKKSLHLELIDDIQDSNAFSGTFAEKIELKIEHYLGSIWPEYSNREKLLGSMIVLWNRSIMFLITKIAGRPVVSIPDDVARLNLDALDELLKMAIADEVRVLLYQAPHKPGEKQFYHDRDAYDAFFSQLTERCFREEVGFLNLMDIVPAEHWGLTNQGLPDVFHFKEFGHHALGVAVDEYMEGKAE